MQFVKNGPDIPERLLQAHEDGRVVFFCGAGISYPANLPGFGGLVDKIYSGLGEQPTAIESAAIKAGQFDTTISCLEGRLLDGRTQVRTKLAEALIPDLTRPHALATHSALLTLSKQETGRTRLITTNFDRLFEEVIARDKLVLKKYEAPLLPVPKNRWDGLIYLHGLLEATPTPLALNQLVVSSGDFGLAYLTERWAARFVSELFRNYTICFVGYSINDPVLRYMMDALAADRLLGESPPEMFAFGSFSGKSEEKSANEWRAKNVTPILYSAVRNHDILHKTIRSWAATHRDGVIGKENIVTRYASNLPTGSTKQDDFVGRMLWAISDKRSLPAKKFATHDPLPSLEWLEPFLDSRFKHEDLKSFQVTPDPRRDENLRFSLMHRPTPYGRSRWMSLVTHSHEGGALDDVMIQIAYWLCRHLSNAQLVLWIAKHGVMLHWQFSQMVSSQIEKGTLSPPLQTLWRIVVLGLLKQPSYQSNLFGWRNEVGRNGLTPTLRLQLRELLSARVQLREPYRDWEATPAGGTEGLEDIKKFVDWEIALQADHVHSALENFFDSSDTRIFLPSLLDDATVLLRDVLELMQELGGASDKEDLSYVHQPSISEHDQNKDFQDWTILVKLAREAWIETAAVSKEKALTEANRWFSIPFPLFRRLAYFAATHFDVVPPGTGVNWLLSDDAWWLWSVETERETLRLLIALSPQLSSVDQAKLEEAVLLGPPEEMFRADIEPERLEKTVNREIWLRLAKMQAANARLSETALAHLNRLSQENPHLSLEADARDEFPFWMGEDDELRRHLSTPKLRNELVQWLRQNPALDHWQVDDWRQRCRDNFSTTAAALIELAKEGNWFVSRWKDALQAWAEQKLLSRSWLHMAPVVEAMPDEVFGELLNPVGWWIKSIAKTFSKHETIFFGLIDRLLSGIRNQSLEAHDDPVFRAINHPVGHVTEALLNWWFRRQLEDQQGLQEEVRLPFTRICEVRVAIFRHGRLLLATHVISLFRVDPAWTKQYVLPLFDWSSSKDEARAAWEGFLWSPRLYRPLMLVMKKDFLATAKHYSDLGDRASQYASILTFAALEPHDTFSPSELATATRLLPHDGLREAASALARAQESAGSQQAEHWQNRVRRYLQMVWPKSPETLASGISESFARLCVATDDAFPDAVTELKKWLGHVEHPDYIVHKLYGTTLPARFPAASLEFLDAVIVEGSATYPPNDLKKCLETIQIANPALESDYRFRRLTNNLRKFDVH